MDAASATLLSPRDAATATPGAARLPWENEPEQISTRQDAWLLSFIDILALLLTLFVLLLAHQDRGAGSGTGADEEVPVPPGGGVFELFSAAPSPVPLSLPEGFAMPGAGLVPVPPVSAPVQLQPVRTGSAVTGERPAVSRARNERDEPAPASVEETADAESRKQAHGKTAGDIADPSGDDRDSKPDSQPRSTAADDAAAPAEMRPEAAQAEADVKAPDSGSRVAQSPADSPHETAPGSLELVRQLQASALGERVAVMAQPGAVSLEIRDNILFTPASAALSGAGRQLLGELAAILRTLPFSVSVEGHSDNVPIHTPLYPSNWELSAARAATVTRSLIEQGIARERLRAIGYGDTRPLTGNDTPENRARNRRVTFVLQVGD